LVFLKIPKTNQISVIFMFLYFLLGAIIFLFLLIIGLYNRLIILRNRVKEAWSDIEIQLKRRYDLIPNIVQSVKGYAIHEKEIFEKVTEARTMAISAKGLEKKAEAENILSGALKTLFAVSENYPDLKANTNFLDLQKELADTENKIQAARRFYNANVRDFNTSIEVFPSNIIAKLFKFEKAEFFDMDENEKIVPQVKF